MTVISYPIPAYQNVPIQPQYYVPSRFVIEDIALGVTTFVTTSENVNYTLNQQVRLLIPLLFGSYQLNGFIGYVVSIPQPNQVELSINSSINVDAFINSNDTTEQAQIVAIGDVGNGTINSQGRINNGTYIPGSFINISSR